MFEMEYFTLPLFLTVLVGFEREVSLISPCKPGMIEEGGIIFKLEDFGDCGADTVEDCGADGGEDCWADGVEDCGAESGEDCGERTGPGGAPA